SALGAVTVLVVVGVLWAAPAAGVNVLKSYQQQRLTCFTHPSSCPAAAGYNVKQSITTVGSGQIRGRGPSGSTQVNLGFLPESQTDFVFAGFAEQRGFVGAALLLGLYLIVVWLLFQIFVNVGMTMGIAPITGIPLPFVSVGGSSLIANLAAMGVLLAIHARGRVSRYSRRRR